MIQKAYHFIRSEEELKNELQKNASRALENALIYKIKIDGDLQEWPKGAFRRSVFVACHFAESVPLARLLEEGALIFPEISGLPYDPYRETLYSRRELTAGWLAGEKTDYDSLIYKHFMETRAGQLSPVDAIAQRLHDHAIEECLTGWLEGRRDGCKKKLVAVMGGHRLARASAGYRQIAEIARTLTRHGFCMASGGGPGAMEATNLGAYLAPLPDEAIEKIMEILAKAPVFLDKNYVSAALEVIEKFPSSGESLAVPTWIYGHEPTNLFASHVAKYFCNSIREDGLLAIATHGVIFTPGKAGTLQEIFMDASQNHYGTFKYVSPMIFLGKEFFEDDWKILPLIQKLAEGQLYAKHLLSTDDEKEVIQKILNYTPIEWKEN